MKFNECKHQDFYLLIESPKRMNKDAVNLRPLHTEGGGAGEVASVRLLERLQPV